MKKAFLLIFILLFGIYNASAQDSPFRFGVEAGVNMSNATIDNKDADPNFKTGYQVGLTVDYTFMQNWLIQSGLSFTTKGSKIDDFSAGRTIGGNGRGETHTFNQLYIQLPIYAAYRIDVSDNLGVVIGAGPYAAYGVGGKTKRKLHNGVFGDGSTEVKFDTFGNGDDAFEQLKKFDFGLGLNISAEFSKIVVGLGYEHGLLNIAAYDNLKYHNRNVALTLGYKF
ncbi:outer membrane protein with beta-barrel domain [Dysgonomonas alginatilytica]|uniref:Outer membrane protein with beta-barrel domain n=1 Tax=Dysgonomonas alginatilytica TaxID=1605892 RepID=A0A2V3PNQ5_9BACT|nr:porin family protein [Dysgonomonas alginatilytica]PXV62487.1 outer membrane protein with beta-barrel domain [Dysgonomonas alginatilytica]